MLRAIIGFDHIGKNLAEAAWLPNCGYAITHSAGNKQFLISSDASLSVAAGVSSGYAQSVFDLSPFLVPGISTLSVGIRFKTLVAGNSGQMFFIGTTVAVSDPQFIANYADMPAAAQLAGGETYLEVVYNLTAGTYSVYWDDVLKGTYTTATINQTSLKAGKLVLIMEHTGPSQSGVTAYRDIVIVDDLPGDGYVTRLGPRVIYPVTLDSASGTDWTSSDGSGFLTALNVPIETAGAATLTSGPSKVPLVTSLKAATLPTQNTIVDGVFIMAAGKTDISSALVGSTLTNGAKSIKGQSKTFTTTLKYGNPLGMFARAPDGSRWTAASIDATSLSLTPDVAS
jgi:hypothetical protein